MDAADVKVFAALALVAIALRLGWLVHQRSTAQKPIYGGVASQFFNFLSGMCFVAILPTVCVSVLILHPEALLIAGMTWHPLLLAVLTLALGSIAFALLHALVERGPMRRAAQAEAAQDARGWTEQDAKTSGL